VHLKTAGTTWLEELIGLAEADGDGLAFAKEIYAEAFAHIDELRAPYASVLDIEHHELLDPKEVARWTSDRFTATLRHDPQNRLFNRSIRQLLHVAFKLAAKKGRRYFDLLEANRKVVAENVTTNLYARHLRPLFIG
jgi:hypothetical protein